MRSALLLAEIDRRRVRAEPESSEQLEASAMLFINLSRRVIRLVTFLRSAFGLAYAHSSSA